MMGADYPKIYLYRRIVQAKLYIDEHFQDKIDLDNISDKAFFSKFHFIRLFKNAYGKTPHQYLTRVRIEKSKLLLAEGVSVSEVCYQVGFESVSSFTGLFKRQARLTPAEFQKKFLERKKNISELPLNYVPNCFAEQYGWVVRR
jgi:AraC-like DNA-binding protein